MQKSLDRFGSSVLRKARDHEYSLFQCSADTWTDFGITEKTFNGLIYMKPSGFWICVSDVLLNCCTLKQKQQQLLMSRKGGGRNGIVAGIQE